MDQQPYLIKKFQINPTKDTLYIIFGIILWITLLLPILIIVSPLFLWKTLIVLPLARKLRPDLIPLNLDDTFIVHKTSQQNQISNPCQVWKLKGKVDLHKFREHFRDCFLSSEGDRKKYENLYCYFDQYWGYLFKRRIQPSSLKLEEHIKEVSIDELASSGFCENEDIRDNSSLSNGNTNVCDDDEKSSNVNEVVDCFVGDWMARNTFKIGCPSWQILLIQPSSRLKCVGDEGTTMCFKIDHGLCDGYSFVHLVDKLSGSKTPYLFQKPKKVPFWSAVSYHIICSIIF
jgi:hypothetical protein